MKKLFTSMVVVAVVLMTAVEILAGQDITGGTVRYLQTTKLDFSGMMGGDANFTMRGGASVRIKDMIASLPKEQRENKVLYFSADKSLFAAAPIEEDDQAMEMHEGGMRIQFMRVGGGQSEAQKVYYDFGKNVKIAQVGFMTRDFIVSGEIENNAWKLTSRVSKILDYTCMAAQLQRDEKTITAWFTSEIPFSVGPGEYFGLPGLILAVEIDGETALLAQSVDLTQPAKGLLAKPRKGKKVSQEEFEQIRAEKIKEFEETRGKGGNRRVVIRHEGS